MSDITDSPEKKAARKKEVLTAIALVAVVVSLFTGILALVLFLNPPPREYSSVEWLHQFRNFDAVQEHQLLSLNKVQGQIGSLNGSGSFFFGSGSASVAGSTQPGTVLGFAVDAGSGNVSILEVPFSKVDFRLDSQAVNPHANFVLDRAKFEKSDLQPFSTSDIIQGHLQSVKLTLSPELFYREVAPKTLKSPT